VSLEVVLSYRQKPYQFRRKSTAPSSIPFLRIDQVEGLQDPRLSVLIQILMEVFGALVFEAVSRLRYLEVGLRHNSVPRPSKALVALPLSRKVSREQLLSRRIELVV
jgi:hypothetical protein